MPKYIDADGFERAVMFSDDEDLQDVIYRLRNYPAADVVERRMGKWNYLDGLDVFECSVCGRQMIRNIFDYCPWCGAEMREGREDGEKIH